MKQNVSPLRWEKAQKYEQHFWHSFAERIMSRDTAQLDWYAKRAASIMNLVRPFWKSASPMAALEIGPGPVGIINFLECNERYALDPLEEYYKTRPELVNIRHPGVTYLTGTGEDLSALKKLFSLIIIDNVLDHVRDPLQVLHEIHNRLEPDGILFLSINLYTRWGRMLRDVLECVQLDRGHPFNFSEDSITDLLNRCGFAILRDEKENYRLQKTKYRRSKNSKNILKSYLGLTDYRYSSLCRKAIGSK